MRSRLVAFTFLLLAAWCSVYLARRDWVGPLVGVVLGWVGHLVWSWGWLEFLDEPAPWRALRSELTNFRNVLLGGRRDSWDRLFQAGGYQLLVATSPAPRHHLVAGIVRTRFPRGARVLDVGCGSAVLYPLIAGPGLSYVGIDVVEAIVKECRRQFAGDARCRFEVCGFEDFHPEEKFDVVVLGEFLYYFPVKSIEGLFRRALGFLRDERSIVVVSMGAKANFRIRRIWRLLAGLSAVGESASLIDPESGGIKTVRVYWPMRMPASSSDRKPSPAL